MSSHCPRSDCLVELTLQLQQVLLQQFQGRAHHLVGLYRVCLQLDFEDVLQRMGYFVAGEFDLLVFEEEDSEKIADRVILQLEPVGDGIGNFMALNDLDSVFFVSVARAQLQPHILTHLPSNIIYKMAEFHFPPSFQ